MSIRYVNNFDIPEYKFSLSPGPPPKVIKEVTGLVPAYDPLTLVYLNGQLLLRRWGNMLLGTSFPTASKGSVSVEPSEYNLVDGRLVYSNGTVLTIDDHDIAEGGPPNQSKTAYLVFPKGLLLSRGTTFGVGLSFDLPNAAGMVNNNDVWAVALNFKNGDEKDNEQAGSVDQRLGITCQFALGGNVRFHGTSYNGAATDPGSYAQFAQTPAMQFSMELAFTVTGGGIEGTGALEYGNVAHSGTLTIPAGFDASVITAVGAAIATTTNGFTSFGARFRSFYLDIS